MPPNKTPPNEDKPHCNAICMYACTTKNWGGSDMCDVLYGGPETCDKVWKGGSNWSKIAGCTLWTAPYAVGKGACRQVQGGALVPPEFCVSVICRTLFMHRVWHRVTIRLFYTEWNMTAGVGVPQVDTKQTCPYPLTILWVCTPWKKSCRRPWLFEPLLQSVVSKFYLLFIHTHRKVDLYVHCKLPTNCSRR